RLPAQDLAGAGALEALGRASVRLHLGHRDDSVGDVGQAVASAASAGGASTAGVSPVVSGESVFGRFPLDLGRRGGVSTIVMLRPSCLGADSTIAKSATRSATRSRIFRPSSGCAISRPRNMIVSFTFDPSPRKRSTWRIFVS